MHNYIAVVFNDTSKAYEALHALWQLDHDGEITVHGTAVVHRDNLGQFQVDTKETHPALATAVGVGVGALLGALAGPAGAAVGAAGGAAIGAATGGVAGLLRIWSRRHSRTSGRRDAVCSWQWPICRHRRRERRLDVANRYRMRSLGGIVYRRAKSDIEDDIWFDDGYYPYDYYLYPYEYIPPAYPV